MFMFVSQTQKLDIIRIIVCMAWAFGIAIHIAKPFVLSLKRFLTYGKQRRNDVTVSKNESKQRDAFPFYLPLRISWSLFYICGLCFTFTVPLTLRIFRVSTPSQTYLPLLLFQFQLFRRLFECLFIHKFSSNRLMPILQVFGAISYYFFAVLTISIQAHQPILRHGFMIRFVVFVVFFTASCVQHVVHRELASVVPIVDKYGIPKSILFTYIACPHYLAEVFIYASSLLVLLQSFPAFLLFIFDVSIMSSAAVDTKKWYIRTFPKPLLQTGKAETWYAIFPFVL